MPEIDGDKIRQEIGLKIRYVRLLKKMTQETLEWNSNVSRRQISDIECGLCDCKITTLIKLVDALDMTITDFISIEVPRNFKDGMRKVHGE